MGFWLPDKCVGYYSPAPESTTDEQIFYFEALCVLSAIHHVTDDLHVPPLAKILIYTNNDNTVAIFNTLRCLPHYNPILIDATDISITSQIHLRVLHIPGELNYVADAISHKNFLLAHPMHASTYLILLYHHSYPLNCHWGLPKNDLFFRAFQATSANSTWKNYGSALNSYLNFIKMHDFPLEPTSETLSLFTVYMSHHIKLNSVATYLSGICQQLEPYFPNVRSAWNSALVHCTLQGCRHLHAVPTSRKRALTLEDLGTVTADCKTIGQL